MQTYREEYETPKDALKAISKIGASPKQSRVLSRNEIKEFLQRYQELAQNCNEYIYHFLIVRKR